MHLTQPRAKFHLASQSLGISKRCCIIERRNGSVAASFTVLRRTWKTSLRSVKNGLRKNSSLGRHLGALPPVSSLSPARKLSRHQSYTWAMDTAWGRNGAGLVVEGVTSRHTPEAQPFSHLVSAGLCLLQKWARKGCWQVAHCTPMGQRASSPCLPPSTPWVSSTSRTINPLDLLPNNPILSVP